MSNNIPIVFIEGCIGCGKSTLVKHMQEYCKKQQLRILTIQEPVDVWTNIQDSQGKNMIQSFYENQHLHAFKFQMMAYISRLVCLKDAFDVSKDKYDIIICERSLHTDKNVFCKMLYDEEKIDTYGYQIYNMWFDHFQSFVKNYSFVYLKTDYEICSQRVKKRQREGESEITDDYLKKNNLYHDEWLSKCEKVLILDGNKDCTNNNSLLDDTCKNIIETIMKE